MKSSRSFTQQYIKQLPGWFLFLFLLFLAALALFGFIAHEVFLDKDEEVDHSIINFLSTHLVNPPLTEVMATVTFFASALFLRIAYAIVVLLYLLSKDWKRAVEISVIGVSGFLINYFMKLFFQRPRPEGPLIDSLTNYSFPSGHAMSGFLFYGLLIYLTWKTRMAKVYKITIGIFLLLFSLLIGFSRVYLRVHYPSDVIAGFCVGFSWLVFLIGLFEYLKKKHAAGAQQEQISK